VEKEDIFIRWAQSYKGLFLKVARAFAAETSAQEDLIQDIMLQLWISVPNFKKQAQESTWVYRVAFNTAVVWDRKRKKYKKLKSVTLIEKQTPAPENSQNRELIEQLYTAIRQLPKLDASLILMSLDGLSYKQMADVSGMTESNVGVKLNRAKKHLAQKMKGLNDEF
jgi:RNA polymerase sigma-70 factor (ECF subfamily)